MNVLHMFTLFDAYGLCTAIILSQIFTLSKLLYNINCQLQFVKKLHRLAFAAKKCPTQGCRQIGTVSVTFVLNNKFFSTSTWSSHHHTPVTVTKYHRHQKIDRNHCVVLLEHSPCLASVNTPLAKAATLFE